MVLILFTYTVLGMDHCILFRVLISTLMSDPVLKFSFVTFFVLHQYFFFLIFLNEFSSLFYNTFTQDCKSQTDLDAVLICGPFIIIQVWIFHNFHYDFYVHLWIIQKYSCEVVSGYCFMKGFLIYSTVVEECYLCNTRVLVFSFSITILIFFLKVYCVW